MKKAALALVLFSSAIMMSCAPKVYVMDRHTILEEEAAAEWPQFEKELLNKAPTPGPTAFRKLPPNAEKKRLYNVLNGEMVGHDGEGK